MENEKKATTAKVEVQNENIESEYKGIYIQKEKEFKKRNELTKEEIKAFPIVLCEIQSKFTRKDASRKDSVLLKVYPFVDNKHHETIEYSGRKHQKFYEFLRLNEDNKIRLTRSELANILLSTNKEPELKDSCLEVLRYARFTTGISPVNHERYYRMQLFLSFDCVKSIFFNKVDLGTMSNLIEKKYISPVVFIEPTIDDIEFAKEEKEVELI